MGEVVVGVDRIVIKFRHFIASRLFTSFVKYYDIVHLLINDIQLYYNCPLKVDILVKAKIFGRNFIVEKILWAPLLKHLEVYLCK